MGFGDAVLVLLADLRASVRRLAARQAWAAAPSTADRPVTDQALALFDPGDEEEAPDPGGLEEQSAKLAARFGLPPDRPPPPDVTAADLREQRLRAEAESEESSRRMAAVFSMLEEPDGKGTDEAAERFGACPVPGAGHVGSDRPDGRDGAPGRPGRPHR